MGKDVKGAAREDWRRVRLATPISIDGWRAFKSKFELCMSKVEDRSPQEERELLFKALPYDWKKLIMEEDGRRSERDRMWLKFTGIPPMTPEDFCEDLEVFAGIVQRDCRMHLQGFLVQVHSEEEGHVLLLLNGVEMYDNGRARVCRHEMDMSVSDIFEWGTNRLLRQQKWDLQLEKDEIPRDHGRAKSPQIV